MRITNVEISTCGIDTEFFTPEARSERGILFIGNLIDAKGLDVLLEAYAAIRGQVDEPLLLAGRNPSNLSFRKDSGVSYLGALNHSTLREAIRRCKLVVLPSRSEGLPLSVLEAMSCNKIVLVTAVGGLKHLVVDSRSGFLLDGLNVRSLGERMVEILSNYEELKTRLGDKPRRSVVRYDIRRVAERHHRLYSHMVSHAREIQRDTRVPRSSPGRDLIRAILVRADMIPPLAATFRWAYRLIARQIARLLRGPGVHFVFLRRGLAKAEFMPFLGSGPLDCC